LQNFGLFLLTFILAQFVHVHPGFVVSPKELGTQIGATAVQQLGHRVGPPTKRGNDMAEIFFCNFHFPHVCSRLHAVNTQEWLFKFGAGTRNVYVDG
jgi:site-specific recombinase